MGKLIVTEILWEKLFIMEIWRQNLKIRQLLLRKIVKSTCSKKAGIIPTPLESSSPM